MAVDLENPSNFLTTRLGALKLALALLFAGLGVLVIATL